LKWGEMGIAVLYVKIFQEMEVIKLLTVWNVTSGVTVISHLPPLTRFAQRKNNFARFYSQTILQGYKLN